MNILDTLTLFGTVALAAPIGLLGIEFLLGGRTLPGAGFLAVALALVAGGYFRPSLKDILAGTLFGGAGGGKESETDPDSDPETVDEETYKN